MGIPMSPGHSETRPLPHRLDGRAALSRSTRLFQISTKHSDGTEILDLGIQFMARYNFVKRLLSRGGGIVRLILFRQRFKELDP